MLSLIHIKYIHISYILYFPFPENIRYNYKCIMHYSQHCTDLNKPLLENRCYFEICHFILKEKQKTKRYFET